MIKKKYKNKFQEIKQKVRGEVPLRKLKAIGLVVGKNFWYGQECTFDVSHCWLISIGDNVTFSSRIHLLAHDASTQKLTGYVKIGRINIGDNVFIGADSIILPGVNIGDDSIIAAGSVVSRNIPPSEVWGGVPARRICGLEEYTKKHSMDREIRKFDESYTIKGGITEEKKKEMIEVLKTNRFAYVR